MDQRLLSALCQDASRIEELMSHPVGHFAWKEIQARALALHRNAPAIQAEDLAANVRFAVEDLVKARTALQEDHYRGKLRHYLARLRAELQAATRPASNRRGDRRRLLR